MHVFSNKLCIVAIIWNILLANQTNVLYVPQNGAQTNYVPQVPHLGHRWGTKTSSTLDGDKFTDFWVDLAFL